MKKKDQFSDTKTKPVSGPQSRLVKTLKVPQAKAKELVAGMVKHGKKVQGNK